MVRSEEEWLLGGLRCVLTAAARDFDGLAGSTHSPRLRLEEARMFDATQRDPLTTTDLSSDD